MPLRKCDLDDVKTFQLALPGYQIHIVSKESFNAIVYQGSEAENKIYLYHHDNHYDVITTMSGFLNRSYFCQKCQNVMITKKSIFAMSLVICARNVTRINRKTGSIVQHAIVISRTRLASNFTLKYRPKAIHPVRRTIVAVCVPPQ